MRCLLFLSLSLVVGAVSLSGCKQTKEIESAKASAKQSLGDFKAEVVRLQASASAVRARFKALPEDLPGIEETRSMLFSVEEVLGVEGARGEWLAGEVNTASKTGKKEQIQKISDEIRGAIRGNKGLEKAILKVAGQLLPFERMAGERRDAGR